MKLLSVDTSSRSASCAIIEDDVLLAESYLNNTLTHSCTLLPMIESVLSHTHIKPNEIDAFAVTVGPGSFTGLRIGLSTIKGMAHALKKPCIAISTLEALAYNLPFPCTIAPVLDARCSQVYTALFRWDSGILQRLSPDEAITIDDLKKRLENCENFVYLVGDGANLCYNALEGTVPIVLASPALRYTKASSVALAAQEHFRNGTSIDAGALAPAYLRLPQAERELLAKSTAVNEKK